LICLIPFLRVGDSLEKQRLEASALELSGDLRWLQQAGINSPSSAGGPRYSIVFNNGDTRTYYVTADRMILRTVSLPTSVSIVNQPSSIYFSQHGSPNKGQTVAMQSTGGKIRYVIVAAVSGRVRLSDTPPGDESSAF